MSSAEPAVARPAAGLDAAALERHLAASIRDFSGPLALTRISGGQSNPTFFVDTPTHRLVLRKQPDGAVLPSAHAIDREYRIQAALLGRGVPVPRVMSFCSDATVIGTPFYVMERVEGRVLADCGLGPLPKAERRHVYGEAARMLARLHAVDWRAAGLSDYGRPDGYFERQMARWTRQWQQSRTRDLPAIDRLLDWLPRHLPQGGVPGIVHGDYRLGNLMLHPTTPRLAAVLDWELSTIGDPMADLAHFCLAWDMRVDESGGLLGLDLDAEGLPTREEVVAAYAAEGGRTEGFGLFHRVFALFRFAVIHEGIAARAKAGNAASDEAAQVGKLSENFAQRAVDVIAGAAAP
ncbi:phosphotransferase family protein [Methylobacterium sp. ID0610]|uniref:phosphotransferase family protein n=1 Tax=Methylobacterium carpenticola TaxID=3344827 RepID=UPI00368DA4F0